MKNKFLSQIIFKNICVRTNEKSNIISSCFKTGKKIMINKNGNF